MLASLLALPAVQPPVSAQRAWTEPARETPAAPVAASSPVSIRINAIVLDRRGRPLVDLKPGDFELDDNGVGQSLSSVELRSTAAAATTDAPVPPNEDEQAAARSPDTRVFALFLDEFNVAPGLNSARVREVATRFLTEYVRPRDLLFVLKPMGSARRRCGSRAIAPRREAAIAWFEGRKGDYEPRTPFETQYIGRTPAAVDGARAQIVTTGLRELDDEDGRPAAGAAAVVLVSEGFSRRAGRRTPAAAGLGEPGARREPLQSADLHPRSARCACARAGRPARRPPPTAGRHPAVARGEDRRRGCQRRAGAVPVLARISRDLDAYYMLTYQPSQATDGRFHPIAVRTKRKDAQVRVPSGYWSPLSSEWRTWLIASAPPGPAAPVRALHRSRLIDTWYGFERDDDGRLAFVFTWEADSPPARRCVRGRTTSCSRCRRPRARRSSTVGVRDRTGGNAMRPDDRAMVRSVPRAHAARFAASARRTARCSTRAHRTWTCRRCAASGRSCCSRSS